MKTLLISFAVLLFLLTLLSSFGGSIRTEPFYDATPAVKTTQTARNTTTPPMPQIYDSGATISANPLQSVPSMQQSMANAPAPPTVPNMTVPPVENKAAATMPAMPATPTAPEKTQEPFTVMQKVDNVPSPFSDNEYGAPLM